MNFDSPARRRQFLLQSAGILAAASVPAIAFAQDGPAVTMTAGDHDLFRVRIELEVEGNVNVPKNPLVSRQRAVQLPLKSEAVFDYEERYVATSPNRRVDGLERYYHEASSTSRVNRSETSIKLRPSVRDTMINRSTLPEVVYATEDYFQRNELELLRVPASSAAVDQLLPAEEVRVGSEYKPSPDVLASLFNLTSVDASDITVTVASITEQDVKLQFRGQVDGSVDGVPTIVRTVAKLTFDRLAKTCTWLAMALHETREISKVEPGFDVSATVRMVRKPLDQTMALPSQPRPVPASLPAERMYVELQSEQLGISALMDRRWRMMNDLPGNAMMRMIDLDRSIAQCDFRSLVTLEPGSKWTLEAFQNDVRQTLGEQLIEFVEAEEARSDDESSVLRLTANGAVQGIPIHWIMLHFSDATGRRILATFTMEGSRRERFAGADAQLTSSLRFIPRSSQTVKTNETPETEPVSPAGAAEKEVASNFGEEPKAQVQSNSSLK
ncbi:MAG: hypothetical protein P8L85_16365 [Rubripirellula sp.]|nr:hypothetical protein [Rubripirellula sp.]